MTAGRSKFIPDRWGYCRSNAKTDIWREACSAVPPGQLSRQRTGRWSRLHTAQGLSAAAGCHAERSEASGVMGTQMLRCAQHDSSDSGPGSPSPLTRAVLSPNVYSVSVFLALFRLAEYY